MSLRGVSARQVLSEGTDTITLPPGTVAGDQLLLFGVVTAFGTPGNITFDDAETVINGLQSGAARLVAFTRDVTSDDIAAGDVSLTVPTDNTFICYLATWSGTGTTVVLSTIGFGSTSVTFPAVSMPAAGTVLRLVFGQWNGSGTPVAIVAPGGHTEDLEANFSFDVWTPGLYEKTQGAAGSSGTATATATNVASLVGLTIGFAAAAPPNAPTLISPADGVAIDLTQAQTFTWAAADPDPDQEQTDAEFGYSLNGTDWTTSSGLGTADQITIPANTFSSDGASYTWRVRTKNSSGSFGPYATRTFSAHTPPDAPTLSAPAAGDVNFSETASWTPDGTELVFELKRVADNAGIADPDTVYATYTGGPDTTSQVVTFDVNGRDEHLLLRTQNFAGLWSPQTDSGVLHVAWVPPPTPVIDTLVGVVNDDEASIHVTYHTPDPTGDEPTVDSVDIYISTDNGATRARVATLQPASGEWTFGFPTSDVDYVFKVVALSGQLAAESDWAGSETDTPLDESPFLPGGTP